MRRGVLWFATAWLAGCASLAPVPPEGEQSAGVGIYVEVQVSGFVTYRADTIYFVKRCLARNGCDEKLIASNYSKEGRVYWLNAEPGEYLAVAAAFESGMVGDISLYFAYFPEALSVASTVEIRPGHFSYAGSYKVQASHGLCPDNAESGQLKYAQRVDPDSPKCGFLQPLLHKLSKADLVYIGGKAYSVGAQTYHYRGTGYEVLAGRNEQAAFVTRARQDLSGSGWRLER